MSRRRGVHFALCWHGCSLPGSSGLLRQGGSVMGNKLQGNLHRFKSYVPIYLQPNPATFYLYNCTVRGRAVAR